MHMYYEERELYFFKFLGPSNLIYYNLIDKNNSNEKERGPEAEGKMNKGAETAAIYVKHLKVCMTIQALHVFTLNSHTKKLHRFYSGGTNNQRIFLGN